MSDRETDWKFGVGDGLIEFAYPHRRLAISLASIAWIHLYESDPIDGGPTLQISTGDGVRRVDCVSESLAHEIYGLVVVAMGGVDGS